jgi:hypothetical protein
MLATAYLGCQCANYCDPEAIPLPATIIRLAEKSWTLTAARHRKSHLFHCQVASAPSLDPIDLTNLPKEDLLRELPKSDANVVPGNDHWGEIFGAAFPSVPAPRMRVT